MSKKVRIFELFSGMGTQSIALEKVIGKSNVEVVGTCDFFLPAIECFNGVRDVPITKYDDNTTLEERIEYLESKTLSTNSKSVVKKGYWMSKKKNVDLINWTYLNVKTSELEYNNKFDITNLDFDNLPECDLLTYSFPCQDISVQGKGKGFDEESSTRSGLLWNIKDILERYKKDGVLPETLLMENVSAIFNKNHIDNFKKWKETLKTFGYESFEYKLNSVDFGSIQSRNRAFLISSLTIKDKKTLDEEIEDQKVKVNKRGIKDILEVYDSTHPWHKYSDFTHLLKKHGITDFNTTPSGLEKAKLVGYTNFNSEATVYKMSGKSPTLTSTGANSRIKVVTDNNELVSISPRGAFQLMGHTKSSFNKMYSNIKDHISYSKLIFVAGNAIPVESLKAIFTVLYG